VPNGPQAQADAVGNLTDLHGPGRRASHPWLLS
jgi:hypothetical protein